MIFLKDLTLKHIKKDKGEKKPSYNGNDVSSDPFKPITVIYGEGEGQVQIDAVDNEAPTGDIIHKNVRE